LAVSNINPADITKVTLYDIAEKKAIGSAFTKLSSGYQVYDKRISYSLGQKINTEGVSVAVYTKARGSKKPALSGVLVNNRTSFIVFLQADQEVTTPTGTAKNDGFASVIAYPVTTAVETTYNLNIVINHDLDEKVTAIHLHAPAASNTNTPAIVNFASFLTNGAKVLNVNVNSTVFYWLQNSLGYLNIHTSKNSNGALRGQITPLTTPRVKLPLFENGATVGGVTILADGAFIRGDVGISLRRGGAKNLTGNVTDVRVAEFVPVNGGTFNNSFRFPLPVTIKNRHTVRSAVFTGRAAAETIDTGKWNFGVLDIDTLLPVSVAPINGTGGRRAFQTYRIPLDADNLSTYLGPFGLYFTATATGVVENLFVDQFYVTYYVSNAYANNILKSIFYKGSDVQK